MARREKKEPRLMVARQTVVAQVNGEDYPVFTGITHALDDHPLVKQNPDLFEPVDKED